MERIGSLGLIERFVSNVPTSPDSNGLKRRLVTKGGPASAHLQVYDVALIDLTSDSVALAR